MKIYTATQSGAGRLRAGAKLMDTCKLVGCVSQSLVWMDFTLWSFLYFIIHVFMDPEGFHAERPRCCGDLLLAQTHVNPIWRQPIGSLGLSLPHPRWNSTSSFVSSINLLLAPPAGLLPSTLLTPHCLSVSSNALHLTVCIAHFISGKKKKKSQRGAVSACLHTIPLNKYVLNQWKRRQVVYFRATGYCSKTKVFYSRKRQQDYCGKLHAGGHRYAEQRLAF